MFTAVAVLQLIHVGKINFDDPVGTYLTDYPNREMAKVTVRQLLSHQGGTGDIGVLQPEEAGNRAWVRTIDDLMTLNGDRGPSFPPGSAFDYSNYGFVLLGALVEKVSGQSYYAYLAEHVFGPAGMTATGFTCPVSPTATPWAPMESWSPAPVSCHGGGRLRVAGFPPPTTRYASWMPSRGAG